MWVLKHNVHETCLPFWDLLLSKGASLFVKNSKGKTPLSFVHVKPTPLLGPSTQQHEALLVYMAIRYPTPLPENHSEVRSVFSRLCLLRAGMHDIELVRYILPQQHFTGELTKENYISILDLLTAARPWCLLNTDVTKNAFTDKAFRDFNISLRLPSLSSVCVYTVRRVVSISHPRVSILHYLKGMGSILPRKVIGQLCMDPLFGGECHPSNFETAISITRGVLNYSWA